MEERVIGKVTHFFGRISVAVLDLTEPLKDIQEAKPGDQVALKVTGRVHEHDVVYKVVS